MKRVLTALVIVYTFSLLGELGSLWWVFDLGSHWRVHYIISGLILVLFYLLLKKRTLAAVAGIVAGIHLMIISPYLQLTGGKNSTLELAESEPTMKVAFVNSYWMQPDMTQLIAAIKEMQPDVVFLEELQPDQYEAVKAGLPEYPFSYHESVSYAFDMGVFSRIPVDAVKPHYFVPNVPTLEVSVTLGDKTTKLIGVHPYSPVSQEFTQKRNELLVELFDYTNKQTDTTVMGGDFNITQFSPVFREVTKNARLIDTQKQFPLENTWPTHVPKFLAIPIDQVFVSPDVKVLERYRGPNTGSDHWPLVVKVAL
jgi:endonuclease/exonuclease/phosphatase (EEP) superfamily protein YafD